MGTYSYMIAPGLVGLVIGAFFGFILRGILDGREP
jgi:hypothetical protein